MDRKTPKTGFKFRFTSGFSGYYGLIFFVTWAYLSFMLHRSFAGHPLQDDVPIFRNLYSVATIGLMLAYVWLLPVKLAFDREHRAKWLIAALTIGPLAGIPLERMSGSWQYAGIGWVVALVWSLLPGRD